ncbi:hypothetical protein ACIRP3_43615 [Streptomyces sp. NPDC101209]|uniref:hypothetical protein n=1 Tax=Streptomyces sp. NPDC101209 TaxID=3366129 RepID=UPI0037F7ED28
MASDPTHRTHVMPAAEQGYGGRYAEDAIDYPSAPPRSPEMGEEAPAGRETRPSPEPEPETETAKRSAAAGMRNLGQLAAARRGLVLSAVAGLLALGSLGAALSMVSDTVSSDPSPGGTAAVFSPTSPAAQPPAASGPASSPADAGSLPADTVPATPTHTAAPSDGDHQEGGGDDQEREDGDRSGDG